MSAPDYAERFEGEFYGGVRAITDLPAQDFMPVYHLMMQACDEVEALQPLKSSLSAALRADFRYRQTTIEPHEKQRA